MFLFVFVIGVAHIAMKAAVSVDDGAGRSEIFVVHADNIITTVIKLIQLPERELFNLAPAGSCIGVFFEQFFEDFGKFHAILTELSFIEIHVVVQNLSYQLVHNLVEKRHLPDGHFVHNAAEGPQIGFEAVGAVVGEQFRRSVTGRHCGFVFSDVFRSHFVHFQSLFEVAYFHVAEFVDDDVRWF